MRFRPRTWFLLSLLLFAAAYWFWSYGEKVNASRRAQQAQPAAARPASLSPANVADRGHATPSLSYRLSNTRLTEKQLLRSNHAILLRNALIDTDRPLKLDIPAHLRATGAPGSYIVQGHGPLDRRFYDRLKKDGVAFVSYIPNNAALVRATPEQARQMAGDASFQAVLPFEPYYKLAPSLLPAAVAQDQRQSEALNVTALPGQRAAALAALQALGAQLMGEDDGPFGTTLSVMVPPEKLAAVAQLPLAQEIEPYAPRRVLNDLTRLALGIATNTLYVTPNYLNLTGSNVTVSLNDTGVDTNHPDFKGAGTTIRLTGLPVAPYDFNGHGTHVAGIIMGNGSRSGAVTNQVPGSIIPGAGFQGKATNATLFVQSLNLAVGATVADAVQVGGSLLSDAALQTNASAQLGPTNLISNNSWGYAPPVNESFPPPPYDMHAASFDQATRDAQPSVKGEQPLLFVFAAGGNGNGNDFGENGASGSIYSPATAKNVITVGAIDAPRFITNEVTVEGQTNDAIFYDWTDNDNLVAWFSSCGNVGAGPEGTFGRFKPDVVAPGVFTISCRATNYVDPTNVAYLTPYPFPGQVVLPGHTNDYSLGIPGDTAELLIVATPNAQSPTPFPNLGLLADSFTPPIDVRGSNNNYLVLATSNILTAGEWYFGVTSVTTQPKEVQPVSYDLTFYLLETNNLGGGTNANGYFNVLSNLNQAIYPNYVYQYGTSMAAGAVSGLLALMQEFLQSKMGLEHPSPALLKALLINGARSVEEQYDFNTQPAAANEQGWGLPSLTNSLPSSLTNSGQVSLLMVDQSTNDALATGQSQSYTVSSTGANTTNFPARITLVWTDPPGDPAAGIALVNNLDLVVTDHSGTNIWLGNDFYGGDIFTEVDTTNLPDAVNNVQNVYIDSTYAPIQYPLTVTVLGLRVNVNAATAATNLIAQDYALVISSDDPAAGLKVTASNAPTYVPPANLTALETRLNADGEPLLGPTNSPLLNFVHGHDTLVTAVSNGVPLLHQRVGANEPYLYANGELYGRAVPQTNGNVWQWHFFVFANTNFSATNTPTNAAFTTFDPPDLATQISPRTNGADLDMYVATDANLTNLDANVIAGSVRNGWASLSRGGTETVILTNAINATYYVGIKSEDQQAADFGFYAVAQQSNFSSVNANGSVTASGTALPVPINDAELGPPGMDFAFMVNAQNPQMVLRNVTVVLGIAHGNPSDLYGTLQHGQTQAVLNNYSGSPGGFLNIYNDLSDNTIPGAVSADGPGTLKNYISGPGQGMWMVTEADNALLQTGQIETFTVTGFPQPLGLAFTVTIGPDQWFDDYVLVPNDATNMDISVTYVSGPGPVAIFLTNQDDVGFNDYGVGPIGPPGGFLNYNLANHPPLAGGPWYYGIYNSNATESVTLNVAITFGLSLVPNLVRTYTNATPITLTTDGTTTSSQCLTGLSGEQVEELSVGVRLNDTNLDGLVLQLTSPQGTSIVLFENRGGVLATNLGLTLSNSASDYVYTVFTENTNLASEPIKFAPPPYATPGANALTSIYTNGFEFFTRGTYTNGQIVDGWLLETNRLAVSTVVTNVVTGQATNQMTVQVTNQVLNEVSVMNDPVVAYEGPNYLALAAGRLSQTFKTIPGASYEVRYYARSPGLTDWWPGDDNTVDIVGPNNGTIPDHDVTYDVGEVDRAFTFGGVSPEGNGTGNEVDFGTNITNFRTNDFTVDFWIKQPTNATGEIAVLEKRPECDDNLSAWDIKCGQVWYSSATAPGHLFLEASSGANLNNGIWISSKKIIDGVFHHVALTRNGANYLFYIDGAPDTGMIVSASGIADIFNSAMFRAGNSVCTGIDGTIPLVGDLDELDVWQRALSPAEIHAIYAAGSAGKYSTNSLYPNFQLAIDRISTNTVILNNDFDLTNWLAYTNSFTAVSNQTTIELAGNPLGVLLDDVQLVQLPFTNYNNYYLPEEPLTPFIGQNPQGCWTLSIWDTRSNSSYASDGTLLSWTLQLTTSSTNVNLIVLTNGIAYTNGPANGITYFGVDVPLTANYATNILFNTSGPMNLLFNQDALPTGGMPGDMTLLTLTAAGAGTNTIGTQGAPPPLVPGQRYFLGVETPGSTPESFSLKVQFDVSANTNIYPLANGVPVSTNISTNGPAFYSFVVPTNAVMVTFQLLSPTNGQANLFAREGLPVPGPLSFDYQSRNEGTNDQFIVVTTNSLPVPLPSNALEGLVPAPPTTWYLSVYDFVGVRNVGYTILATYVTTNASNAMNVISLNTLANYTCYETNAQGAPPGFPTNLMYSFTINNPNLESVEFTVTNISANGTLQLLAGDGVFPTPEDFYIGSFNPGVRDQSVVIVTNSSLITLSNIWYLAVPNVSPTTAYVKYSISAIVTNAPVISAPLIVAASITAPNQGFTMYFTSVAGQTYQIDVSTNLASWSVVTNITAQSNTASYTDSVPVNAQPERFFRLTTQ